MNNAMRWVTKIMAVPRLVILGALNLLLTPAPRSTSFNGRMVPCREGGWVGLALSAAGLVEGFVGQNKAQGSMDASGRLATDQANDAERDKRLSGQLYTDYNQIGLPAEEKYVAAAEKPIDPNAAAGQAITSVDEQANKARTEMSSENASYGLNPNSGRSMADNTNFNLNEAVAKAGAATTARRQAVQQTLANLGGAAGVGSNLLSGAESFAGLTPAGFNGSANIEAGLTNNEGQLAAGGGQLLGYGLSGYMNNNNLTYNGAQYTPSVNTGSFGTQTPIYQMSPDQPTPSLYN